MEDVGMQLMKKEGFLSSSPVYRLQSPSQADSVLLWTAQRLSKIGGW